MKLLGWMHRKFKQNSSEIFREFSCANPCSCLSGPPSLDEQQRHHNSLFPVHDQRFPKVSDHDGKVEQEDPSPAIIDLFHGLLAIGTFGSSPGLDALVDDIAGSATPTFGVPLPPPCSDDDQTEKKESDLSVVDAELEKFMQVLETDDESLSPARDSVVSVKQLVISGGESARPLQEYLLGLSPEKLTNAAAAESEVAEVHRLRKECQRHRSLGELFEENRMAEEAREGRRGGGKKEEKPMLRVREMVEKILKLKRRRGGGEYCGSSQSSSSGTTFSSNATMGANLKKIMQIFRKKVHPENSSTGKKEKEKEKKVTGFWKCSRKGGGGGGDSGGNGYRGSDGVVVPDDKETILDLWCRSALPKTISVAVIDGCGSNKEYWIKTDAEYLVLEL